jgi:N-acetylneuraminic acid mutarotase
VGAGLETLLVGGTDPTGTPQASVFATVIRPDGNIDAWSQGAALPAPRAQAAAVFFTGTAYVIGGLGADGQPTDTVFAGTPDVATGKITTWTESTDLKLPAPRAGASVAVASDGIFLVGGTDGKGPVNTVWKSALNATTGKLQAWTPNAPLTSFNASGAAQPAPRVHSVAYVLGQNLFVWGGEDAAGPTPTVLRGDISTDKATLGQVTRWGTSSTAAQNLPAAHKGAFGWVANSNLYYAGGAGSNGEIVWAIPDANGNIPRWVHLAASDLPSTLDLQDAAPIVSGSHVFLVGGTTSSGATTGTARANLSPALPFFQLGLFYIVVPAMGIQGPVGQQLSYLAAAGVATGDFVLLLLLGYAFNHKERTRAFLHHLRNRRRRTA